MVDSSIFSVDVCTSALNEEEVIRQFVNQVLEKFEEHKDITWRLIVVDNGSSDNTWKEIESLVSTESRVTGIKLTRNFGFDNAIIAALRESSADASIVMASDLQDDPKYIYDFIEKLREGYEHVYQVVLDRPSISRFRQLLTRIFYRVGSQLTYGSIVPNGSDFRIISRRLREALIAIPDQTRLNRAILSYFSVRATALNIPRGYRISGESKTSFRVALSLGIRGIFSNSKRLLDYVGILSIWMVLLTFCALLVAVFLFIFVGVPFNGFGTIVGLVLLLSALNFLALGIMAQYLGIITEIVQKRPLYVVDKVIGNQ